MEEPFNPVKVVEVCKVAPPPSSGDFTLPLTFFDLTWLSFPPNQYLFFYELPADHPNTAFFYEIILPKLKHSLSITLQRYLPLAGNLIWEPNSDQPILRFIENDAVSVTVAESQADFHRLSSNTFRAASEFHHLSPGSLPASETKASVMAFQFTLFPNMGFSIGYAVHHAVMDGKSTTIFMNSWASICRFGGDHQYSSCSASTPLESTPFYDRTAVKGYMADLERRYSKGRLPNTRSLMPMDLKAPSDVMVGTFHLTREEIENLKKQILADWEGRNNKSKYSDLRLSTFSVVTAYTLSCLVKSQDEKAEKVLLVVAADCRGRSEPPHTIRSNYFGNCIIGLLAEVETKVLMGEDGVAIAAEAICDSIKGLNDQGIVRTAENTSDVFPKHKGKLYSIAGSPHLNRYKIDFGFGKPKKVELISIAKTGAFSLCDPKDGMDGIEIGVALSKDEAQAFATLFASSLVMKNK